MEKTSDDAQHSDLAIDFEEATCFLNLLAPDEETFIFAAGDDNAERKKALIREAKEQGRPKPVLFEHHYGPIEHVLPWLEQQQARGWGVFVTVQSMKGQRRLAEEAVHVRAAYHEWDGPGAAPNFPLQPSIVVESSTFIDDAGEVHSKLHSYWLTDNRGSPGAR